jgi:general secretion pathway protein I
MRSTTERRVMTVQRICQSDAGKGTRRAGLAGILPPMVEPWFKTKRGDGARSRSAGFTLVEVLVAFAIAMPALALLYRQGVLSVNVSQSAVAYQEAISRGRSHLDALIDTAMIAGDQTGDDGGFYRWRTRIVPIATTPPPRVPPRNSPYVGGTTLYSVEVQIAWPGPRGTQTLVLQTRRLGPASLGGP